VDAQAPEASRRTRKVVGPGSRSTSVPPCSATRASLEDHRRQASRRRPRRSAAPPRLGVALHVEPDVEDEVPREEVADGVGLMGEAVPDDVHTALLLRRRGPRPPIRPAGGPAQGVEMLLRRVPDSIVLTRLDRADDRVGVLLEVRGWGESSQQPTFRTAGRRAGAASARRSSGSPHSPARRCAPGLPRSRWCPGVSRTAIAMVVRRRCGRVTERLAGDEHGTARCGLPAACCGRPA